MRILVIGAGRMGRDVGLAFLRAGIDVAFVEADAGRREAASRRLSRDVRRLAGEGTPVGTPSFALPGEAIPACDALFETVDERPDLKRRVVAEWKPIVLPGGLLLTNASSILPSEIDPACVGMHAFYPAALAGFCEVVVPPGCPPGRRDAVLALARRIGMAPILQDEAHAFAVNRLMLPAQDWALRAVAGGADAGAVDAAASGTWPGWQPLATMDAIGLDVVAASVTRYRARMDPAESAALGSLQEGLEVLLAAGKRGAKNGDGLRQGTPLPWPCTGGLPEGLGADLEALFRNACARALASGEMDPTGLSLALFGLFGVPYPPAEGRLLDEEARERCERRAVETGLAYWRLCAARTP